MVVRRGQFQPMALIELADEIPPPHQRQMTLPYEKSSSINYYQPWLRQTSTHRHTRS